MIITLTRAYMSQHCSSRFTTPRRPNEICKHKRSHLDPTDGSTKDVGKMSVAFRHSHVKRAATVLSGLARRTTDHLPRGLWLISGRPWEEPHMPVPLVHLNNHLTGSNRASTQSCARSIRYVRDPLCRILPNILNAMTMRGRRLKALVSCRWTLTLLAG